MVPLAGVMWYRAYMIGLLQKTANAVCEEPDDRRTANMTVPDMPYAWLRTGQIRLSENLTLKLFPGNVFFYAYLLTTAVTVFVLRQTQRGRYWAQRRIAVCACFTYGEAAFVAATLLLSVMFFIYWLRDHNYKQTWSVTAKESAQIEAPERWGRGLGQLAILFLSVLLLPVGRQSLVVSVLGVSRDGMLWFHRAVGYAMLAATVGHVVAFYVSYASFGYLLQNLNTVSNRVCKKGVFDDYSVLVATWTTWFLLIAMGVFGLSFVRRRYYELFYYTHLAATYMTLPVMVFHASAGWMYLLPGMTVFLADQLVRVWQRSAVVRLVHARVISEDTTELAFSVPGRWDMRRVHPGQYVLVCVPELTALQWHPFTLTNVVDAESVEAGGSRVSAVVLLTDELVSCGIYVMRRGEFEMLAGAAWGSVSGRGAIPWKRPQKWALTLCCQVGTEVRAFECTTAGRS
ncbi:hypothetical protein LSCM1_03779 [Leishmania martiniquensis]|uniref:FAD-binding FR-type domain-containing protein n=1 Tax=Leishmania martiniquensis TaxID=1580590 RepID=A0A836GV11_9TRYP|nr:hypothetical protein LSCM1_03779 [Leishmania martiniquensis]